ncbi:hypothetical protein OH77DRAFT_1418816 [Trametes cingulata]|nr:hypothetical protein OH77DRAFT_1418816 [Trametes cingulata]
MQLPLLLLLLRAVVACRCDSNDWRFLSGACTGTRAHLPEGTPGTMLALRERRTRYVQGVPHPQSNSRHCGTAAQFAVCYGYICGLHIDVSRSHRYPPADRCDAQQQERHLEEG